MIKSTSNKQVKFVSALNKKSRLRREEGLFVAEGRRLFAEIPKDQLHAVYVSESFLKEPSNQTLIADLNRVEPVSDEVFATMSDTRSPQGILALVRQRRSALEEVLRTADGAVQLLILETLQDPGNLGTIIRAGEGAGVTGVIMDAGTADIYNPKVIRSTMGSIFRVPFLYVDDLPAALKLVSHAGIRLFAAHLDGTHDYDEEDYTEDIGFIFGNEGSGLSDVITAMADTRIRIPMSGQVESLNAAVAASVLMFEAARQRRLKKSKA